MSESDPQISRVLYLGAWGPSLTAWLTSRAYRDVRSSQTILVVKELESQQLNILQTVVSTNLSAIAGLASAGGPQARRASRALKLRIMVKPHG